MYTDSDITEYIDTILKAIQEQLRTEKEHIRDLSDTAFCSSKESVEQDEGKKVYRALHISTHCLKMFCVKVKFNSFFIVLLFYAALHLQNISLMHWRQALWGVALVRESAGNRRPVASMSRPELTASMLLRSSEVITLYPRTNNSFM